MAEKKKTTTKKTAANKPAVKNRVGRPYKIQTVEELQQRIDEYFDKCEGTLMVDENGIPILTKWGQEIRIGKEPPTVTGLALAIGLGGRQAFLNYQGREEFKDTISRAKARCEAYAEGRLYDKDGGSGAQFSLRNNFKGWKEDAYENNEALDRLDNVLDSLGGVI